MADKGSDYKAFVTVHSNTKRSTWAMRREGSKVREGAKLALTDGTASFSTCAWTASQLKKRTSTAAEETASFWGTHRIAALAPPTRS